MSKLAVKYNNDLNSMPLRDFKSVELDLFMTICASVKEEGTNIVTYDFDKLRELSRYEFTGVDRFIDDLQSTYDKLIQTSMKLTDGNIIEAFTLFSRYKINKAEKTVEIQVSEYFKYILNDLNLGNFTRYRLNEYTDIKSTYSKAIYQRLKQWKTPGRWEVGIDEFRRLLSIPDTYKMGNIDQRVLDPAKLDLAPFFVGLKIQKLDKSNKLSGKGRPVKKIVFTFQKQDDSITKIQSNKYALGKYENVYLTEKEHAKIKMEMRKGYLIEDVSVWKNKKKSESNNNDFALIMAFDKNKERRVTEENHEVAKMNAKRKIGAIYDNYKEEEMIDVNGDFFKQLLIDVDDLD